MTVNTKMDYRGYLACVEEIANSFFDDEGNYAPHIGKILTMSLFMDYCVEDSGIDTDAENVIDQIFDNDEVVRAFNNEILCGQSIEEPLSFASAYWDAMGIVEHRRSSVINQLPVLLSRIKDILTPEYIESVKEATEDINAIFGDDKNVIPLFPNKKE